MGSLLNRCQAYNDDVLQPTMSCTACSIPSSLHHMIAHFIAVCTYVPVACYAHAVLLDLQHSKQLLWGWYTLRFYPPDALLEAIAKRLTPLVHNMDARTVSEFMWAFGGLNYEPSNMQLFLQVYFRQLVVYWSGSTKARLSFMTFCWTYPPGAARFHQTNGMESYVYCTYSGSMHVYRVCICVMASGPSPC